MKFGKKLKISSKTPIMEKSVQIFTIIKYQKISLFVNNVDRFFLQNRQKLLSSSAFKQCKYVVKEKKIIKYIINDTEISSDSDRENSDEENLRKVTNATNKIL